MNNQIRNNKVSSILILFVLIGSFACQTRIEKKENKSELKELLSKSDELYANNQYEQAIVLFKQIINIDSTMGIAYYRRGICFAKTWKYQEGINDHLKCVVLNYRLEDSYFNLGLSYMLLDQNQQHYIILKRSWI
jgi:tetratricopeptide (TPR) repeat protein